MDKTAWLLKVKELVAELHDTTGMLKQAVNIQVIRNSQKDQGKERVFTVTLTDEGVVRHRFAVLAQTKEDACQKVLFYVIEILRDPPLSCHEMSATEEFYQNLNADGIYQFF